MSGKTTKTLGIVLISLFGAGTIGYCVYAVCALNAPIIGVLLLTLAGIIISWAIGGLTHEIGHLIASFIMGVKVKDIAVFGFEYDFDKKSFSFSKSKDAGWVTLKPCADMSAKKLRASALGAFIPCVLILALNIIIAFITKSYVVGCLLGAGGFGNALMGIINFVPYGKDSDGYVLFDKGDYVEVCASAYVLIAGLESGIAPSDLQLDEILQTSNQPLAAYWRYIALRAKGSYDEAKGIIDGFDDPEGFSALEYNLIVPEILFSACENGEINFLKKAEPLFEQFSEKENLPAIRAHLAYRKLSGESEWAAALEKTYISSLEKSDLATKSIEGIFTHIEQ